MAKEQTQPAKNQEAKEDASEEQAQNGEQEVAQSPPAGKGKLKLVLFIGGPVLLLLIVGAVLYFLGIFGGHSAESGAAQEEEIPLAEQLEGVFVYDMPSLLINLRGTGKRTSFLKITINLEVKGEEADKHNLDKLKPRVIDQFQTYLRELEVDDLQGSAGLQRVREELLDRVNMIVKPLQVQNVLFEELLVQ